MQLHDPAAVETFLEQETTTENIDFEGPSISLLSSACYQKPHITEYLLMVGASTESYLDPYLSIDEYVRPDEEDQPKQALQYMKNQTKNMEIVGQWKTNPVISLKLTIIRSLGIFAEKFSYTTHPEQWEALGIPKEYPELLLHHPAFEVELEKKLIQKTLETHEN